MGGDDGTLITKARGGTFVVRVPSIPTTGYTWEPEYDHDRLELVRSELTGLRSGVGGGGIEEFEFRALEEGPTALRLLQRRPWDPPGAVREVRTYDVEVGPAPSPKPAPKPASKPGPKRAPTGPPEDEGSPR